MRKIIQLLLLASRILAICAVLAGLAAGLLDAFFGAALVCFDACPSPGFYFSNLVLGTIRVMTPCVALELLALVTFVAYCLATGQARRAIRSILILLVGGLVGVAALYALMLHGQATLPITAYDVLEEGPVVAWAGLWGMALLLVAVAWSAVLAYLQWAAE